MRTEDARAAAGYLPAAVLSDAFPGALVLDPASTMVSPGVRIDPGAVLYPGVVLRATGGEIVIGPGTQLWPGTRVLAGQEASVRMGADCLCEGGVAVRADRPGGMVWIGDSCRLSNGVELIADSTLGAGAQILGRIVAVGVELAAGDPFTGPDPDARAAVLKGFGTARGLRLGVGEVVNGVGDFGAAPVERQLAYHPRPQ